MEEPTSDNQPDDATSDETAIGGDAATCELPDDGDIITREHHDDVNTSSQAVQHVRTTIPVAWGVALDHATADLRITKTEAVREGVGMFLRFHGRGRGIPEPLPPIQRSKR